jgi:hypothetical protein
MQQDEREKKYKGANIIFMVVHYEYECTRVTLLNILAIIDEMPDTYLVLINSNASLKIKALVESIQSNKVDVVNLPINFGYNHGVNYYIKDFISSKNLPKCIVSLGSDILFNKKDFELLIEAVENLPKYATLSLSYDNNKYNPERNVLKSRWKKGENGKAYAIRHTFCCPVAGGIMAIRGDIVQDHLDFELFPPKYIPKVFQRVVAVGGADSALYKAIRWKFRVGYLAETRALHMKSRTGDIDIPKEWHIYIEELEKKALHYFKFE